MEKKKQKQKEKRRRQREKKQEKSGTSEKSETQEAPPTVKEVNDKFSSPGHKLSMVEQARPMLSLHCR